MTTVTAPLSVAIRSRPRKLKLYMALPLALGVAIAAMALTRIPWPTRSKPDANIYFTIAPMDLDVKVVKDGELAAVNNIDISNLVEGQTTIQQIVKEGAYVKKGDILITLDSASIKQKIEDTTLEVQKADADLIAAKEMRDIQKSQNDASLDAAVSAVKLAELDLQQYEEGSYPQARANATIEVEMAKIPLKL